MAEQALWVYAECRRSAGPWAEERWRPVAAAVEPPPEPGVRLLHAAPERDLWLLGAASLELHKSDAASYRYTLAQPEPMLFVALRRADGPAPAVLLVTAASDEAQSMLEGGDDVVEPVPMPEEIRAWIADFVAAVPEPEPFRKRQRQRYDPETAGVGRRERP